MADCDVPEDASVVVLGLAFFDDPLLRSVADLSKMISSSLSSSLQEPVEGKSDANSRQVLRRHRLLEILLHKKCVGVNKCQRFCL